MTCVVPRLVRTRLSVLMFLEFFVWGGWNFALAGYASGVLALAGWQVGWLMAVPAVGAIISPLFVGLIADRLFATERILCGLHILGAVCLIAAGFQHHFAGMMTFMMLDGLLFMPTVALVNALSFRHLPDPDRFPRIAVLGTIGWIVAVLVASVLLGGANTPNFFFLSGIGGIVLGLYCLTLPHTPPRRAEDRVDAFGLHALKLLKDRSFLVFIICMSLFGIPACQFFFTLCVPLLQQRGYPAPLALTTLNQFAEIVFMFSMPWFVARLGLKRVLMIGMSAWILRYVCFASSDFAMVLVGLLLHGFCYSFLYVGAYMYVDRRAPEDLKASAQSLLALLLIGLGSFLGANLGGAMMDRYPAPVGSMADVIGPGAENDRPLPPWNDPRAATSAWRYLDLSATIKSLWTGAQPQPTTDLAGALDANRDEVITMREVETMPAGGLKLGGATYSRAEMIAVVKKIASLEGEASVPDQQIRLTRPQWLAAQSCDWKPIWLWPAGFLAVILAVFAVAFREQPALGQATSDPIREPRAERP